MYDIKDINVEEEDGSCKVYSGETELDTNDAIKALKELLTIEKDPQGIAILERNIALLGGNSGREDKGCLFCRYFKADPFEAPHLGYYCFCEDSPHFGKIVAKRSGRDGPACACFETAHYEDMSLLDALKIITCSIEHPGYPAFFHKKNAVDDTRPFIAITFETNSQLENWRDANVRLFTEMMRIMHKNGEI